MGQHSIHSTYKITWHCWLLDKTGQLYMSKFVIAQRTVIIPAYLVFGHIFFTSDSPSALDYELPPCCTQDHAPSAKDRHRSDIFNV